MKNEKQPLDDRTSIPEGNPVPGAAPSQPGPLGEAGQNQRKPPDESLGTMDNLHTKEQIDQKSSNNSVHSLQSKQNQDGFHELKLELLEKLGALENNISQAIEGGQMRQARQLHDLSVKLDDVAYSFSEPRLRDLLSSLLLLYDLLDQMANAASQGVTTVSHADNYRVVRSQVRQILELNGIKKIPTDIDFDESLHHACATVKTDDPSEDGKIVRVLRQGFKSKQRVLRYADVEVTIATKTASAAASETDSVNNSRKEESPDNRSLGSKNTNDKKDE